ncbi:hypothetical protein BGZ73_003574 [Actinomortierella ambigua]|nr:hypothetical protein BGZ73_003574 [Actinomortierella ambigua]
MPPAGGGSAPVFPPGSESCQKCRYFFPKLAECNAIANETLTKIPREPLDAAGYATLSSSVNFTTIMPLLQCICPNQGLAATKVCTTCFRGTGQQDFLGVLASQNVTTHLSSWKQACLDSGMGDHVPPQGAKGQSAASAAAAKNGASSSRPVTVLVRPGCPPFVTMFAFASVWVWGVTFIF